MKDFSIAQRHLGAGLAAGFVNGLVFLLVPYGAITAVMMAFPPLAGVQRLESMRRAILLIGTMIAFLAFMKSYYPRGSLSRALSGVARQGGRVAWLYAVLSGGAFSLEIPEVGPSVTVALGVDVTSFLLLIYGGIAVTAAYFAGEYFAFRRRLLRPEF